MTTSKITIIGLGITGASIGAALQQEDLDFEIVGHDREPEAAAIAKRRGDVHRTEWNLHRACDGAGLVVLAVPLNEMPEVLEQIQEDLAAGGIILCLSDVMQPVLAFGEEILPDSLHLVVGHPILTGLGTLIAPRADLFDEVQFCIGANVDTDESALDLVNGLVQRLGATPLYLDATEHDGIVSLVEHLPRLLGAALVQISTGSSGWRDGKKLAGRRFAQVTDIGENGAELSRTVFANRENVLTSLRRFEELIVNWRTLLEEDEEGRLQKELSGAATARSNWEKQALLKDWDRMFEEEEDTGPGFLRQMFFGNLMRNRGRDNSEE